MKHITALILTALLLAPLAARAGVTEVRPVVTVRDGVQRIEYRSGDTLVARSADTAPAGVELKFPGADWVPVTFHGPALHNGVIEVGPEKFGTLTLRWRLVQETPSLVERTLEVTAAQDQKFAVTFPFHPTMAGAWAAFSGPVTEKAIFHTGVRERANQTFPVAMLRTADSVYGVIADSPAYWERTSEKVKSPFGLRVISAADGSLLPGHNGSYCYGGSWFFCDSGNYLLAGVHRLPAEDVDARLIERIQRELAKQPAFNEDINTVTGDPHGNAPYADYSVYIWLRQQIRQRMRQTEPDRVGQAIDKKLGVVHERDVLRLGPGAEAAK